MQKPSSENNALLILRTHDSKKLSELALDSAPGVETVKIENTLAKIHTADYKATLSFLVDSDLGACQITYCKPDASSEEQLAAAMHSTNLEDFVKVSDEPKSKLNYEAHFQPIVDIANRSIIGYEGLIRAETSNQSLEAEDLIAKAIHEGWLQELDEIARSVALESVGPWLGEGLIFLNIMAPTGLFDLAAVRRTATKAQDMGLELDQLVLETAERNRFSNIELASAQTSKIHEMGLRIAIDDIGEGYSSLILATSFRPDVLKISGKLVSQLPSNEALAAIEAIVSLAHGSGAWVVAEQVENEPQARVLGELGVDWAQGHLFGAAEKH